jgi:Protein of unknown function (DUF2505)
MAKRFAGDIEVDVAPDVVFAAQSDPHYVVWKHEHMAAFDVSADVQEDGAHIIVRSSRKLPAQIPSAARKFVGESIQIDEVHTWSHPETDGSRHGKVDATFGGAPMEVYGTIELHADGAGSVLRVVIHAKAHVPIVGGKIENIVGEQFMRALRKEQQISPQWFTE